MPNLTLTIGQLKITPFFWTLLLAAIFSSFSFWRGLKEDFPEEEVYKLTLLILSSALILGKIVGLLVRLPILGVFLGGVLALIWRKKNRPQIFWEELDHLCLAWIYFSFFGGIGKFLSGNNPLFLSYTLLSILGFLLYLYFKKNYRSFLWYKSGKTGFLFWSLSGYFFFGLFLLDFLFKKVLYWENWLLIVAFFLSLGMIYFRSERVIKEDLRHLTKKVNQVKKR